MRAEVIKESPDRLKREVWKFFTYDYDTLLLEGYTVQERNTTRHKYVSVQMYRWRDHDYVYGVKKIKFDDVPLPDSVTDAAKRTWVDQIVVLKELPGAK